MMSEARTVRQSRSSDPGAARWVLAALGLQVLVASIGVAATGCTDTLERSRVTRVTGPVAQAIRGLVEQRAVRSPKSFGARDEVETERSVAPSHALPVRSATPDLTLLDLPPPSWS